MSKGVAVIALTLALGVGAVGKTHHHQQEAAQGVAGKVSDSDAWRHFLLHVAALSPASIPSWVEGDQRTIINTARKFRAEFEKAIDDFKASQETRVEAEKITALNNFIAQRDAMVESYKNELMPTLTPQGWTQTNERVHATKIIVKAATKSPGAGPATGEACGLPNDITCAITYSLSANPSSHLANLVGDTFDRANGAPGSDWTTLNGAFVIAGDAITVSSGGSAGTAFMYYNKGTFTADQTAMITLKSLPRPGESMGVTVRQSANANTAFFATFHNNAGTYEIVFEKVIDSSATVLGTWAYSMKTGDNLCLSAMQNSISVWLNGQQILAADGTSIKSGYPGIGGTAGTAAATDFEAGSDGAVMTFNPILDGTATMAGNALHARHTPTVMVTIDGVLHNNSGKRVCPDCYLYVSANVSLNQLTGVQYAIRDEGIVVCSEARTFVDATTIPVRAGHGGK